MALLRLSLLLLLPDHSDHGHGVVAAAAVVAACSAWSGRRRLRRACSRTRAWR